MKKIKSNKALTLIALIVTIIFLLIIAAVTINMVLGENGLFNKAQTGVHKYKDAQDEETSMLAKFANLIPDIDGSRDMDENALKDFILNVVKESGIANPVGTIIAYYGDTAPTGYLPCDGTQRNTADYSELATFLGATEDTFNLPDLKGEFLRGAGTNSHTNQGNGAAVRTHQDATEHTNNPFRLEDSNTYAQVFGEEGWNHFSNQDYARITRKYANITLSTSIRTHTSDLHSRYTSRPTNTSVLYCIKY